MKAKYQIGLGNYQTIKSKAMKRKLLSITIVMIAVSANAQNWSLTGNIGTNPATNFIGTLDAQKLIIRTNNIQQMAFNGNGQGVITIGNIDPNTSTYGGTLQIKGDNTVTAIDLVKAPNSLNNWDNQIRFYNVNNLRHVIADDYSTGKLLIQTNVDPASGSVNFVDIRGKVQITRDGSISITTPGNYDLYVAEGILTEKVKVAVRTSADWADYVFKREYPLMSISEVEKYVSANNHLPGVPSATEMVNNGNDLGKTDAKLLEKIEELTLYIIEMNKRIEKLERKKVKLTTSEQ